MEDNMARRIFYYLLLICVCTVYASAQIEITLRRDFVDSYADRVTIDSNFRVDVTSKIHPPSQDGDIHVAGTSSETGMLTVAEVILAMLDLRQQN
jgi:hypothetical protein